MPANVIATLARQYKTSVRTVEGYWNRCKSAIHPVADGKKGEPASYGVVVNCVKAKLRKLKAQRRPKRRK